MLNNITLFNFSKNISEFIIRISDYNSFNYNFPGFESIEDKRSQIYTKEEIINYNIKKIYVNLPSNNRFKEERFKKDFFANYDNTFAGFCGLTKKMFTEIYLNNLYIPNINSMGDIELNIDNIIKNLNEFSETKRLKIKRRIRNPYKPRKKNKNNYLTPKNLKKLFKINGNVTNNNNNNEISLEENNLDEKNNNENESLCINNNDNNKDNTKKPQEKSLINIKNKLNNISIFKLNTTFMNNENKSQMKLANNNNLEQDLNNPNLIYNFLNDISSLNNIDNLNNDSNLGIFPLSNDYQNKLSQNQDFKFSAYSNKNNIFNFSSNEIINLSNNPPKINNNNYPIFTPLINNENENNNLLLSPYKSLFTQNNYNFEGFNSLLSPNITNNYHNNSIFNTTFNFKNNEDIFINEENNSIQNDNYEIINDKEKNEEKNDKNKNK